MKYRGTLHVADPPNGSGLPVEIVLSDSSLTLTSADGDMGTYPLAEVSAERIVGRRFRIDVGGETLHFQADDPLGFSYDALPHIAQVTVPMVPETITRMFKGFRTRKAEPEQEVSEPYPPVELRPVTEIQVSVRDQSEIPVAAASQREPIRRTREPSGPGLVRGEPGQRPARFDGGHAEAVPAWSGDDGQWPSHQDVDELVPSAVVERMRRDAAASSHLVVCPHVRSDGVVCGSTAVGEAGYCFAHDPAMEEERAALRERTAAVMQRVASADIPNGAEDLIARLRRAVAEVHEGILPPERATAMAMLVQAMCDAAAMESSDDE